MAKEKSWKNHQKENFSAFPFAFKIKVDFTVFFFRFLL